LVQPVVAFAHEPPAQAYGEVHAARGKRGTPSTSLQVPTLPDSPQASHWLLHAVLQHTLSMQ
jgi:hypothetical protein